MLRVRSTVAQRAYDIVSSCWQIYLYQFAREAPDKAPAPHLAYHGSQLFYVFHNLNLFSQHWTKTDRTPRGRHVVVLGELRFIRRSERRRLPTWPTYLASH